MSLTDEQCRKLIYDFCHPKTLYDMLRASYTLGQESVVGLEKIKDAIITELHNNAGLCGHCGKRKCHNKKLNSFLPGSIKTDEIIHAIDVAISKISQQNVTKEV